MKVTNSFSIHDTHLGFNENRMGIEINLEISVLKPSKILNQQLNIIEGINNISICREY